MHGEVFNKIVVEKHLLTAEYKLQSKVEYEMNRLFKFQSDAVESFCLYLLCNIFGEENLE